MLEPHILLYLDGVTVSFDRFKALNSLSLVLEEGELRTIIGPNGVGKTTLLKAVLGQERTSAGTIRLDGAPWTACRRGSGRGSGSPPCRRVARSSPASRSRRTS